MGLRDLVGEIVRPSTKMDMIVRGDGRPVLEELANFLKEHKDLYRNVRGPHGMVGGRTVVVANVALEHVRYGRARVITALIGGLVDPVFMNDISGGELNVVAEPLDNGRTKLKITADGAKPGATEPLLTWIREHLAGVSE